MSIPAEVRGRFYALRAMAVALCVFAAAAFYLRPDSYRFLLLGLAAISVGIWLVRRSNAYLRQARGQVATNWSPANAAGRVGPLAWTLTGVSLLACGVGYYLMHLDALHAYKQVWPLNVFLGAVLALVVTSGYVAMRIFR